MGLCGDVSNTDQNNIYGVIPYIAPEVLKGELYTQAADVYSFGMIMYFVATGKQPFADFNMPEAPKCYIYLMKQCWNSNPDNRPKTTEIFESIKLFCGCYNHVDDFENYIGIKMEQQHYEIENQFKEAEEYRKSHLTSFDENKRLATHSQAIYTSRLLNPFTKNIPKYDNVDNNTVEIIDFTQ
ncbi:kinase-like domain-containing protein [Rhizophagus irregularis DAOM 181602=DAOM 197198]|uniref:Kinase-like domain-containing protein n=1 Tax=Rhizophagus irregularis (strain DAOM 181602 / DAOM 197198 / MUCL 43194) TaxID=747089 RepID=A0A2P4P8U9_RHIID|nr:kinase-like domain-containing protein [Rhizophagus irregularis DAOM 181602=DAOM 197198]POG61794.1 kinase-like domain-containing protein [Rhizophagus irregularis DAOM 181602=DAOM 197198]|eukprot:XP_025168660.1 kinase-like domain-containing protein [Rhizophagus irregularis DAOM 181602=DAOM 197198]